MRKTKHKGTLEILGIAMLALALVGCNATGAMTPEDPMPTVAVPVTKSVAVTDAGQAVTPISDPKLLKGALAVRDPSGPARSDPFALTTNERYFETTQEEERVFDSGGGFSVQVTPKPEPEVLVPVPEAQPYRRLSGIVVGDAVLAILIEEGRPGEAGGQGILIRPGMQLPNSPWRVLSIDQDKAVLVRSGNVLPTQVVVRLETPPPGQEQGAGNSGNGVPGAPGGFPGVPGGGRGPVGGRPPSGGGAGSDG